MDNADGSSSEGSSFEDHLNGFYRDNPTADDKFRKEKLAGIEKRNLGEKLHRIKGPGRKEIHRIMYGDSKMYQQLHQTYQEIEGIKASIRNILSSDLSANHKTQGESKIERDKRISLSDGRLICALPRPISADIIEKMVRRMSNQNSGAMLAKRTNHSPDVWIYVDNGDLDGKPQNRTKIRSFNEVTSQFVILSILSENGKYDILAIYYNSTNQKARIRLLKELRSMNLNLTPEVYELMYALVPYGNN